MRGSPESRGSLRQRIRCRICRMDHIDHDSSSDSSSEEEGQGVVAQYNDSNIPGTSRRSEQGDNRVYNDEHGETKVEEVAAGSSGQADDRIVTDERGQTSVKYDEEGERMEIDYVDDEDHPFMTPGEEDNDDTSHDNCQQPRGPGREGPQVEGPHGDEQENKEEDEGTVVTVVRDDDDEHQRKAFKSREEEKKK
uniref:acidic leucine-rich nuclear phosphoprotein 32 family member B-like isoform X2 n=1 Tax=Styela clava TaxID=7725 RepID=UPI00193A99C9|nr:acidic leucine-rich nuclear phosphoprotein 32 family member B-like isoform X2 [Styela clava]